MLLRTRVAERRISGELAWTFQRLSRLLSECGGAGYNEVDRFVSRFLTDQNQGGDHATRGLRRIQKHRECRGIRRKVLNFSSRLSSPHLEVYIEEGVTEFSNLETPYSLYSRVLVFFDHVS